jgi:hypothetical protein
VLLCLLPSACRSAYYDARFGPVTNEVRLATTDGQGQARALVSVRGVRRAADGEPASSELRLRLENLGSLPFTLDLPSLELLCGDLLPFGRPRILSNDPPQVAPGAAAIYELRFPMPDGHDPDDVNFSGLNLRFTLDFGTERVTAGTQFERIWAYHAPPSTSFGFYYGYAYCD